jgi:high-affinity Fe2+/Pb2+ permease
MDDPDLRHSYTRRDFAETVVRMMGTAILALAVLLGATQYFLSSMLGREPDLNPAFAVTAVLYLGFVLAWAIAYSRYFRFPENQKILLTGAGIAAGIASVASGILRLALGQAMIAEVLTGLPEHLLGSVLGALIQIYGLAIGLRYLSKIKLPF